MNEAAGPLAPPPDQEWFHLDGTLCVAGWHGDGPERGRCVNGNGPITPCPDGVPLVRQLVAEAERLRAGCEKADNDHCGCLGGVMQDYLFPIPEAS